ncbi:MAG: glycoside hydrolase family 16 protein, partial [Bacteroidetes bacterium]|nr:glycoside hydrolase family 16 protein [Bacteroidota bacterium]
MSTKTALQKNGGAYSLVSLFLLLLISSANSQCSQLVWADEFNGSSLDLSKWSYQIGNGTNDGFDVGWGNQESQYYTSRPENISVTGGNLVITARAENYLGAKYTSGRIRSLGKGDWKYGSFEARIKVPEPFQDSRLWPAFWMVPNTTDWPHSGEIDIMETGNIGNEW